MRADPIVDAVDNAEAVIAQHRDLLAIVGLRTAVRRAKSARLCRRSRWQARQAQRLLQQRLLRGVIPKVARTRKKSARRPSRPRLALVTPVTR